MVSANEALFILGIGALVAFVPCLILIVVIALLRFVNRPGNLLPPRRRRILVGFYWSMIILIGLVLLGIGTCTGRFLFDPTVLH